MRENLPLPARIQNAPELDDGLEFYLGAFFDLNSERSVGMDLGPIPWRAVHEYGQWLRLTDEELEDLHYHVKALDEAYIEHQREKRKSS